tara:strand:- start:107 stop:361 length:255 start_codon:yes stop_codon:yes gene_type:complete
VVKGTQSDKISIHSSRRANVKIARGSLGINFIERGEIITWQQLKDFIILHKDCGGFTDVKTKKHSSNIWRPPPDYSYKMPKYLK